MSQESAQKLYTALTMYDFFPDSEEFKRGLDTIRDIATGDTIANLWSIEDVASAVGMEYEDGREVPDDIARETLANANRNMDAQYGINWDTIIMAYESVV